MKKEAKITRISMAALEQLREQSMGYCAACGKWTTGCTEPDARKRPCDRCGERQVYGADEAGFMGLLEVTEGEE